jgi:two-component system, chemotaxis family, protein-glutamate methylesterase/glutaminase
MAGHDIIVIGASAGGVEALQALVRRLPGSLPAAILVVLHLPPGAPSVLPSILSRAGPLAASHPEHDEPLRPGRIYVAPPDQHLLIADGRVHLALGPRENGHRPAIDPLFRTAARAYGRRVVGVVLSGALDDGTAGLAAIKLRGGTAVVQDPEDALFDSMPKSAMQHVAVDHVVPAADLPDLLARLVGDRVGDGPLPPVSNTMEVEARMAELDPDVVHESERPGAPSAFACPDCGGVLWELADDELIRFRCRVGHAYSPDSLTTKQLQTLEDALWVALRAMEEQVALTKRLRDQASGRGQQQLAERFAKRQEHAESRAELIRQVLADDAGFAPTPEP